MKSTALFNIIWVLESLPQGELKTGYSLVNDKLSYICSQIEGVEVIFKAVDTKTDFLIVLDEIHIDTKKNGKYPIIHIECHGSTEGLATADGDLITWEDLRFKLININIASKLNLIITLAACHGAHIIKTATYLDRAPFWGVIGPTQEVTAGSIEENFDAFYTEYLTTLSGDNAINAINKNSSIKNREYHFYSSMLLFISGFKEYYQNYCIGKKRNIREERLLTKALQDPTIRKKGIRWIRNIIKQTLRDVEGQYNSYLYRFFMLDIFEENKERFYLPYDEFKRRYSTNNRLHSEPATARVRRSRTFP